MATGVTELHGVCAALELPAVLRRVTVEFRAGRLRVGQRGTSRFVWFGDGRVRNITSSLEDERLGSWLVARGLVERQAMRDVLIRKPKEERFGAALVREKLMDPARLKEELVVLAVQVAGRMLLEDAVWEAEGAWVLEADASSLDLPPSVLFLEASRRVPDSGQLPRLVGGGRRWSAIEGASADGLELLPLERLVLTRLASARTFEELCATAPQQTTDLPRALASLAAAGLARFEGGARAAGQGGATAQEVPLYPPASPRLRERLEQADARVAEAGSGAGAAPAEATATELAQAEQDKRQALVMLDSGGDLRVAYKLLAQAVDLAPDADALVRVAEVEVANPLWRQRALDHLKRAVALDPRHTQAWLALANYWSLRGQQDKQRRCLEKILACHPANEDARRTLELLDKTG